MMIKCDSCNQNNFKSMQYEHDKHKQLNNKKYLPPSLEKSSSHPIFKKHPSIKHYSIPNEKMLCLYCYQPCNSDFIV